MTYKLILFGTGHDLPFYESLLNFLNINIYCYTDNNKSKWNTFLNGKKIIPPADLKNFNNKILITCSYIYEIKNQLRQMDLTDRIITVEDIIKYSQDNYFSYFQYLKNKRIKLNNSRKIIFDLLYGNGWGGSEIWSFTVAEELINKGYDTEILSMMDLKLQSKKIQHSLEKYMYTKDLLKNLVDDLSKKMPFTFINNMTGIGFLACYILKCYFPDYVKVISVLHSDDENYYSKCSLWQEVSEKILCVSSTIRERAYKQFGIKKEKLIYKASPIAFDQKFIKKYSLESEPIKIGFAARLEVTDKRADLIIPLIKKLVEQHVNFVLDIAGNGSCLKTINSFISASHLESNVHVLGYVEYSDMPEFWKTHDVYINLSEREGCCLSMMEAMSYGVVPVVTNVSGVRDFIINGENGFVSSTGDLDSIVKNIKYLSENKNVLYKFGDICRNNIYNKCNKNDYIDFIESII